MTGLATRAVGGFAAWKIGAIIAALVMVVLGGFLVKTSLDNRNLEKQKSELTRRIEDPVTGYIAQLNTARNNVVILKGAIEKQNSEFRKQSAASQAELNRLRGELKLAQAQSRAYQKRVNELMSRPIKGNNATERMEDVDKMILEDLRK
jgi:hypothetical protein